MKKKITLKDIAQEAGVDISTVSKALRKSSDISISTQERIQELADNLGYRPNLLAKSLINKRSNMLGVIIPDLRISFFSEATRGIYEKATKHGFESILLVHDENPENERKKLEFLSDINVDGILLDAVDATTNLDLYKKLQAEGIKIVCWDRIVGNSDFSSVTINDKKASYELTSKFIEAGRKKIMFIGPRNGISVLKDRYDGYLMALKEHEINVDENLIIQTDLTAESAHNNLIAAIQNGIEFDAIVSVGGLVAYGAGNAILESELKIPEDVILGEFGNNRIVSMLGIPFYTVFQNPYLMGEKSVEILIENLDGKEKKSKPVKIEVEHKICHRNVGVQKINEDTRFLI